MSYRIIKIEYGDGRTDYLAQAKCTKNIWFKLFGRWKYIGTFGDIFEYKDVCHTLTEAYSRIDKAKTRHCKNTIESKIIIPV